MNRLALIAFLLLLAACVVSTEPTHTSNIKTTTPIPRLTPTSVSATLVSPIDTQTPKGPSETTFEETIRVEDLNPVLWWFIVRDVPVI